MRHLTPLLLWGIIVALGWQHQALLRERAALLWNFMPIARTYVEMESFRTALADHIRVTGAPPRDLPRWLSANFTARSKRALGRDAFGGTYVVHRDGDDAWKLRSCGADRICNNSDDLTLVLIPATAAKRGRPW